MKNYTVVWEITIEADTPRQAAELARQAQTAPDTLATCFKVIEHTSRVTIKTHEIDLGEKK